MSKMTDKELDHASRLLANNIYRIIAPQVLKVAFELMQYYNDDENFDENQIRTGDIQVQVAGNVFIEFAKRAKSKILQDKRKIIIPRG